MFRVWPPTSRRSPIATRGGSRHGVGSPGWAAAVALAVPGASDGMAGGRLQSTVKPNRNPLCRMRA